jgi:hypothetical protein
MSDLTRATIGEHRLICMAGETASATPESPDTPPSAPVESDAAKAKKRIAGADADSGKARKDLESAPRTKEETDAMKEALAKLKETSEPRQNDAADILKEFRPDLAQRAKENDALMDKEEATTPAKDMEAAARLLEEKGFPEEAAKLREGEAARGRVEAKQVQAERQQRGQEYRDKFAPLLLSRINGILDNPPLTTPLTPEERADMNARIAAANGQRNLRHGNVMRSVGFNPRSPQNVSAIDEVALAQITANSFPSKSGLRDVAKYYSLFKTRGGVPKPAPEPVPPVRQEVVRPVVKQQEQTLRPSPIPPRPIEPVPPAGQESGPPIVQNGTPEPPKPSNTIVQAPTNQPPSTLQRNTGPTLQRNTNAPNQPPQDVTVMARKKDQPAPSNPQGEPNYIDPLLSPAMDGAEKAIKGTPKSPEGSANKVDAAKKEMKEAGKDINRAIEAFVKLLNELFKSLNDAFKNFGKKADGTPEDPKAREERHGSMRAEIAKQALATKKQPTEALADLKKDRGDRLAKGNTDLDAAKKSIAAADASKGEMEKQKATVKIDMAKLEGKNDDESTKSLALLTERLSAIDATITEQENAKTRWNSEVKRLAKETATLQTDVATLDQITAIDSTQLTLDGTKDTLKAMFPDLTMNVQTDGSIKITGKNAQDFMSRVPAEVQRTGNATEGFVIPRPDAATLQKLTQAPAAQRVETVLSTAPVPPKTEQKK